MTSTQSGTGVPSPTGHFHDAPLLSHFSLSAEAAAATFAPYAKWRGRTEASRDISEAPASWTVSSAIAHALEAAIELRRHEESRYWSLQARPSTEADDVPKGHSPDVAHGLSACTGRLPHASSETCAENGTRGRIKTVGNDSGRKGGHFPYEITVTAPMYASLTRTGFFTLVPSAMRDVLHHQGGRRRRSRSARQERSHSRNYLTGSAQNLKGRCRSRASVYSSSHSSASVASQHSYCEGPAEDSGTPPCQVEPLAAVKVMEGSDCGDAAVRAPISLEHSFSAYSRSSSARPSHGGSKTAALADDAAHDPDSPVQLPEAALSSSIPLRLTSTACYNDASAEVEPELDSFMDVQQALRPRMTSHDCASVVTISQPVFAGPRWAEATVGGKAIKTLDNDALPEEYSSRIPKGLSHAERKAFFVAQGCQLGEAIILPVTDADAPSPPPPNWTDDDSDGEAGAGRPTAAQVAGTGREEQERCAASSEPVDTDRSSTAEGRDSDRGTAAPSHSESVQRSFSVDTSTRAAEAPLALAAGAGMWVWGNADARGGRGAPAMHLSTNRVKRSSSPFPTGADVGDPPKRGIRSPLEMVKPVLLRNGEYQQLATRTFASLGAVAVEGVATPQPPPAVTKMEEEVDDGTVGRTRSLQSSSATATTAPATLPMAGSVDEGIHRPLSGQSRASRTVPAGPHQFQSTLQRAPADAVADRMHTILSVVTLIAERHHLSLEQCVRKRLRQLTLESGDIDIVSPSAAPCRTAATVAAAAGNGSAQATHWGSEATARLPLSSGHMMGAGYVTAGTASGATRVSMAASAAVCAVTSSVCSDRTQDPVGSTGAAPALHDAWQRHGTASSGKVGCCEPLCSLTHTTSPTGAVAGLTSYADAMSHFVGHAAITGGKASEPQVGEGEHGRQPLLSASTALPADEISLSPLQVSPQQLRSVCESFGMAPPVHDAYDSCAKDEGLGATSLRHWEPTPGGTQEGHGLREPVERAAKPHEAWGTFYQRGALNTGDRRGHSLAHAITRPLSLQDLRTPEVRATVALHHPYHITGAYSNPSAEGSFVEQAGGCVVPPAPKPEANGSGNSVVAMEEATRAPLRCSYTQTLHAFQLAHGKAVASADDALEAVSSMSQLTEKVDISLVTPHYPLPQSQQTTLNHTQVFHNNSAQPPLSPSPAVGSGYGLAGRQGAQTGRSDTSSTFRDYPSSFSIEPSPLSAITFPSPASVPSPLATGTVRTTQSQHRCGAASASASAEAATRTKVASMSPVASVISRTPASVPDGGERLVPTLPKGSAPGIACGTSSPEPSLTAASASSNVAIGVHTMGHGSARQPSISSVAASAAHTVSLDETGDRSAPLPERSDRRNLHMLLTDPLTASQRSGARGRWPQVFCSPSLSSVVGVVTYHGGAPPWTSDPAQPAAALYQDVPPLHIADNPSEQLPRAAPATSSTPTGAYLAAKSRAVPSTPPSTRVSGVDGADGRAKPTEGALCAPTAPLATYSTDLQIQHHHPGLRPHRNAYFRPDASSEARSWHPFPAVLQTSPGAADPRKGLSRRVDHEAPQQQRCSPQLIDLPEVADSTGSEVAESSCPSFHSPGEKGEFGCHTSCYTAEKIGEYLRGLQLPLLMDLHGRPPSASADNTAEEHVTAQDISGRTSIRPSVLPSTVAVAVAAESVPAPEESQWSGITTAGEVPPTPAPAATDGGVSEDPTRTMRGQQAAAVMDEHSCGAEGRDAGDKSDGVSVPLPGEPLGERTASDDPSADLMARTTQVNPAEASLVDAEGPSTWEAHVPGPPVSNAPCSARTAVSQGTADGVAPDEKRQDLRATPEKVDLDDGCAPTARTSQSMKDSPIWRSAFPSWTANVTVSTPTHRQPMRAMGSSAGSDGSVRSLGDYQREFAPSAPLGLHAGFGQYAQRQQWSPPSISLSSSVNVLGSQKELWLSEEWQMRLAMLRLSESDGHVHPLLGGQRAALPEMPSSAFAMSPLFAASSWALLASSATGLSIDAFDVSAEAETVVAAAAPAAPETSQEHPTAGTKEASYGKGGAVTALWVAEPPPAAREAVVGMEEMTCTATLPSQRLSILDQAALREHGGQDAGSSRESERGGRAAKAAESEGGAEVQASRDSRPDMADTAEPDGSGGGAVGLPRAAESTSETAFAAESLDSTSTAAIECERSSSTRTVTPGGVVESVDLLPCEASGAVHDAGRDGGITPSPTVRREGEEHPGSSLDVAALRGPLAPDAPPEPCAQTAPVGPAVPESLSSAAVSAYSTSDVRRSVGGTGSPAEESLDTAYVSSQPLSDEVWETHDEPTANTATPASDVQMVGPEVSAAWEELGEPPGAVHASGWGGQPHGPEVPECGRQGHPVAHLPAGGAGPVTGPQCVVPADPASIPVPSSAPRPLIPPRPTEPTTRPKPLPPLLQPPYGLLLLQQIQEDRERDDGFRAR